MHEIVSRLKPIMIGLIIVIVYRNYIERADIEVSWEYRRIAAIYVTKRFYIHIKISP